MAFECNGDGPRALGFEERQFESFGVLVLVYGLIDWSQRFLDYILHFDRSISD